MARNDVVDTRPDYHLRAYHGPGMVVRKVFRIRIRTFVQAHRIASHRFRIAFAFRIRIAFFALFFLHFRTFLIFLLHVSWLVHQKSSTKCEKI